MTAVTIDTPRSACSAATTGARLHSGSSSRICSVSRCTRRSASPIVSMVFLKGDPLRSRGELQVGEPLPVAERPCGPSLVTVSVSQQQSLEPMPRTALARDRVLAGSYEISKRLVVRARDVDRSKLPGPAQSRQRLGVPAVGLDPISASLRRHRWRDHRALQALCLQVTVQMESARTRLVDEAQPPPSCSQLLHHAIDRSQIAADLPEVPHLPLRPGLRGHHVDRFLVDIETHRRATLCHGPASLHCGSVLQSRLFTSPRA